MCNLCKATTEAEPPLPYWKLPFERSHFLLFKGDDPKIQTGCYIRKTSCCAMSVANGVYGLHGREGLKQLKQLFQEAYDGGDQGTAAMGPNTLLLVVSQETEKELEENLEAEGFQKLTTFKRRKVSGAGKLTLWGWEVK